MDGTIEERKLNIIADRLQFPEGPAFAPDGSLWLVELKGESLVQIKEGAVRKIYVGGKPNGIAIDPHGRIWFCDSGYNAIRSFNPVTREIKTVVDKINGGPLSAPNDLVFDSLGNLIFTCPGNSRQEPTGYVCALMKNGDLKKIVEGKYFPNGLALTNDGKEIVIAETYKHRVWKGDWDSVRGECTSLSVFAETGGPIGPDGMAYSDSGDLYVAVYGSGELKIISATGTITGHIALPGRNPTNCAFDPGGILGLVITEAEKGTLLAVELK